MASIPGTVAAEERDPHPTDKNSLLNFEFSFISTKGGGRVKEKRSKFQIKTAINLNQDPTPLLRKLAQLQIKYERSESISININSPKQIENNINSPGHKEKILKGDPQISLQSPQPVELPFSS